MQGLAKAKMNESYLECLKSYIDSMQKSLHAVDEYFSDDEFLKLHEDAHGVATLQVEIISICRWKKKMKFYRKN